MAAGPRRDTRGIVDAPGPVHPRPLPPPPARPRAPPVPGALLAHRLGPRPAVRRPRRPAPVGQPRPPAVRGRGERPRTGRVRRGGGHRPRALHPEADGARAGLRGAVPARRIPPVRAGARPERPDRAPDRRRRGAPYATARRRGPGPGRRGRPGPRTRRLPARPGAPARPAGHAGDGTGRPGTHGPLGAPGRAARPERGALPVRCSGSSPRTSASDPSGSSSATASTRRWSAPSPNRPWTGRGWRPTSATATRPTSYGTSPRRWACPRRPSRHHRRKPADPWRPAPP